MSNRAEQLHWQRLTPSTKRGLLALKENATVREGRVYNDKGDDVSHIAEMALKTTQKQRDALEAIDEMTTHEVENGKFVFALFESRRTMDERYDTLTQADMARLMFLGTYTGYQSGRLEHDNGRAIDKKSLGSLINLSRNKFAEFYRKMIDEEILQERDGDLYVNPSVFYRGPLKDSGYQLDDYRHTRLFRKTVRELYGKYTGRKTAQLAVIYAVLPFLNFNTNVVCFNPEENNEDELKPMNLENLAALLGYKDTHKLKRVLEAVKIDDQPVFWLPQNVHDKRQRRIIVNPRVVFAGKAESLRAVKVFFN